MPSLPGQQKGLTFLGFIFVLILVGFFALLALKLIPVYLENLNVKGTLDSLQNEPFITQKSKNEIKTLVRKRFDINDIERATMEHVTVSKERGKVHVGVAYEARENIFGNIDVAITFDDDIEIVAN